VVNQAGFSKVQVLNAVTIGTIVTTALTPVAGTLADCVGRKPLYLGGAVAIMAFAFPYFAMLDSGLFSANVRDTGVTVGCQMGAALAGSTAPLVATWMLDAFNNSSTPIAISIIACGIISLACIALLGETKGTELKAGRS